MLRHFQNVFSIVGKRTLSSKVRAVKTTGLLKLSTSLSIMLLAACQPKSPGFNTSDSNGPTSLQRGAEVVAPHGVMSADDSVESDDVNSALISNEKELADVVSPEEIAAELGIEESISTLPEDSVSGSFSIENWNTQNGVNLTDLFQVVVLVNKATSGEFSQTAKLYVGGVLKRKYLISTGREKWENPPSGRKYFSSTPVGFFSPKTFSPNHYSRTWNAPMKWAVFFNGGIALHATVASHYAELGRRASGGCVRFREEQAEYVYNHIYNAGRGLVPVFTQSGSLVRNADGSLKMQEGYKTLIIVENSIE